MVQYLGIIKDQHLKHYFVFSPLKKFYMETKRHVEKI